MVRSATSGSSGFAAVKLLLAVALALAGLAAIALATEATSLASVARNAG